MLIGQISCEKLMTDSRLQMTSYKSHDSESSVLKIIRGTKAKDYKIKDPKIRIRLKFIYQSSIHVNTT